MRCVLESLVGHKIRRLRISCVIVELLLAGAVRDHAEIRLVGKFATLGGLAELLNLLAGYVTPAADRECFEQPELAPLVSSLSGDPDAFIEPIKREYAAD